MGTRNLVCVVLDGKMKVAQYGQWDGYLEGQGKTVINFIGKQMKLTAFKKAVRECRWLTEAEVRETWVKAGDKPDNKSGMVNMEVSDRHSELFPALSRDTCGQILRLIQDGKVERNVKLKSGKWGRKIFTVTPPRGLQDSASFAADSLFCEWAYVVDLDNKVLEIYRGFNKTDTAKGRFAEMREEGNEYNAISLWQTVAFSECKKAGTLGWLKEIQAKEDGEE